MSIRSWDALIARRALFRHHLFHDLVTSEVLAHEYEIVAGPATVIVPEPEGEHVPALAGAERCAQLLNDA